MTLEQLVAEEKKMTAQTIPFALFIGLLVGVAIWAATHHKGFVVTIVLLLGAVLAGRAYAQRLRRVQAEISRRQAER